MSKEQQSFEQQITELETLVTKLSNSDNLEEALKDFERGLELAQKASDRLNKIENKLTEIKDKFKVSATEAVEAIDEEA